MLDHFSRCILARKLCTTITATDAADTVTIALRSSGLERVRVRHRPRLLSDNGPSYLSAQLSTWLAEYGMKHTRGRPYHPMNQGKIERYHRSLKDQILLENYYLPGQLEARLAEFVEFYNTRRHHESLGNLTPRYLLRARAHYSRTEANHQAQNHRTATRATSPGRGLNLTRWVQPSLVSALNLSQLF